MIARTFKRLRTASDKQALKALLGLSPLRMLIMSYGVFFIGLFVIPVQPTINFSTSSVAFFMLMILACGLGVFIGSGTLINTQELQINGNGFDWHVAARRCVYLATIGIFCTVIDRYMIRGVALNADMFEARADIEQAGTGLIAVVAAFLSSFSAFSLIAVWIANFFQQPISRLLKYLAVSNLVGYIGLSLSLGSRSLLLACFVLYLIAITFLKRLQGKKLNFKSMILVIALPLSLVLVLVTVLLHRLELMGLSAIDSIQYSGYAYTISPTSDVLSFLANDEFTSSFGAALYSLILYLFHGFYEFLLLFDDYRGPYTHGEQLFWLPLKLLGYLIPISSAIDLDQFIGYRSGIFTTFAGPFFIDFGLLAPILIVFVFALLAVPYRKVVAGDLRWIFAAFNTIVIIVFAPVMPLLQSAVGAYTLVAAISMVFLIPRRMLSGVLHKDKS